MKRNGSRSASIPSAASHLDREPGAMHVMAHADRVLRAGRIFEQIAPPALARVCRVANLKAGVVVIHTEHGAAANKLRQQTAQLIDALLKRGLECSGIEVRVQPTKLEHLSQSATPKPISEQALTQLLELSASMRNGPLKTRLEFLVSHALRDTPPSPH